MGVKLLGLAGPLIYQDTKPWNQRVAFWVQAGNTKPCEVYSHTLVMEPQDPQLRLEVAHASHEPHVEVNHHQVKVGNSNNIGS